LQKDTTFVAVATPYLAIFIKCRCLIYSRLASATFTVVTDIRAFIQFSRKYIKIRQEGVNKSRAPGRPGD